MSAEASIALKAGWSFFLPRLQPHNLKGCNMFDAPKSLKPSWVSRAESRTRVNASTGCWLYFGPVGHNGYATLSAYGHKVRLHRISYEHFVGNIKEGMCVCHKCDRRTCWNPDHLFLGTQKDNVQDMIEKGRLREPFKKAESVETYGYSPSDGKVKGSFVPTAKLKAEDIPGIRERYAVGDVGLRTIAKDFGVSHRTIRDVIVGNTWSHVS